MVKNNSLRGIIPAAITPMNEKGDIEWGMLEKQIDYLVSAGVDGLFLSGGTGEGAYLTLQEKLDVFKAVKKQVGSKVFLCAACITPSTRMTITEIEATQKLKPDYIVSVPPFYHAMSQNDIIAHFKAVSGMAKAPLIIYNIPSTTHNPLSIDTVWALSELPNIAGVKDSSGDFCSFSRGLLGPRTSDFSWIQGEDYLCGPSFLTGADGAVSGLSNARVEPYVAMYAAARNKDWETVKACQAQINDLYEIIRASGCGNAGIKVAATLAGRSTKWMRQVSQSLSEEKVAEMAKILKRYDAKYGKKAK